MFVLGSWKLTSGDLSWWGKQLFLLEILGERRLFFSIRNNWLSAGNVLKDMKQSFWFRTARHYDLFESQNWVCSLVRMAQIENNCTLGNDWYWYRLWLQPIFSGCPSCLVTEWLSGSRNGKILVESDVTISSGWTVNARGLNKAGVDHSDCSLLACGVGQSLLCRPRVCVCVSLRVYRGMWSYRPSFRIWGIIWPYCLAFHVWLEVPPWMQKSVYNAVSVCTCHLSPCGEMLVML